MRRKRIMHKPEFKAKVAQTALRGEVNMAEVVKKFDVQAALITQWEKQLLSSTGAAFDKGDQLADEHDQVVLVMQLNRNPRLHQMSASKIASSRSRSCSAVIA